MTPTPPPIANGVHRLGPEVLGAAHPYGGGAVGSIEVRPGAGWRVGGVPEAARSVLGGGCHRGTATATATTNTTTTTTTATIGTSSQPHRTQHVRLMRPVKDHPTSAIVYQFPVPHAAVGARRDEVRFIIVHQDDGHDRRAVAAVGFGGGPLLLCSDDAQDGSGGSIFSSAAEVSNSSIGTSREEGLIVDFGRGPHAGGMSERRGALYGACSTCSRTCSRVGRVSEVPNPGSVVEGS